MPQNASVLGATPDVGTKSTTKALTIDMLHHHVSASFLLLLIATSLRRKPYIICFANITQLSKLDILESKPSGTLFRYGLLYFLIQ